MEEKLSHFLNYHNVALANKRIVIGVSGGPDSVALLHLFYQWRKTIPFLLNAVTIDHQLREAAKEDVHFVERICKSLQVPLTIKRINVKAYMQRNKTSTQIAARKLRYEAFRQVMEDKNAHYLVLGHHGDDQIETIMMALLQRTNLASLQGIPFTRPFSTGEIIRPLLAVNKDEIEQYLKKHGLRYRIDESNQDLVYMRNYIRKLVVPPLKEKNNRLHVTIQQLAETLQEDEQFLKKEAEKCFEKIVMRSESERKVTIPINALKNYPVALQRRIYRLTLNYLYEVLPPQLSYSHERIFLSLLKREAENKILHFPQRLIVEVVYDRIECYFKKQQSAPFSVFVQQIPSTVPLPNGDLIEVSYERYARETGENEHLFPAALVELPIQIRNRKPGDRIRYKGLNGSKKLKDLFIDEKIPRKKRDEAIVIADDKDNVLWVVGIRKGILKHGETMDDLYISFKYVKTQEGDIHA